MLVVLAMSPACGKKESGSAAPGATDCVQVGMKLVEMSRARAGSLADRQKNLFETQIQIVKDRFIKACKDQAWPDDARACFLAARNASEFGACTGAIAPAKQQELP